MSQYQLRLLGSFQITKGEEPATGFRSEKERALLAYLATEASRPHSREALAGLLWPDLPDETAHNNLRVTLHRLRQVVGDQVAAHPILEVSREAIQLSQSGQIWIDVSAFEGLLSKAEQHPHEKLTTCQECMGRYAEAAALYQGEFLQGIYPADSLPFSEWALLKREHLHQQALQALYLLAAYHQRRGELDLALKYAHRQLALEPWREEAYCQVMTILALRDESSAALRQFERCCRVLREELGVEPAEETCSLYERILTSRKRRRHNLPLQATPFIGRKSVLNLVNELLENPDCRLLTILGPGGIGKSRLAFQAAEAQIYTYLHGVFIVHLAGLPTQGELIHAIGVALDFLFQPVGDPKTQLLDYLREKEMLLVLDNYEHLLETGKTSSASILVEILENAPGLRLLVTSRQRLNLSQEWIFVLEGLSYPVSVFGKDLEKFEAVQLFLHNARRINPGFQLAKEEGPPVGLICHLLEGVPLAIELAAAWTRVMVPRQIVLEIERNLDFLVSSYPDLPQRHRSLRAAFDHSWRLLSGEERSVLRKISVFRGGFEREAASYVGLASRVTLVGLVDKSLINLHPDGRYHIHEIIRQFAATELDRAKETVAIRDRHSIYFMELAEQAGPELWREQQKAWMDRLDGEYDNLCAALEWNLSPQSKIGIRAGLTMLLAVETFWLSRGHFNQAGDWLATLLAHPQATADPKLYADGLRLAAFLEEWTTHQIEVARAGYERSLAIAEAEGDLLILAHILSDFGNFKMNRGDLAGAQRNLERGLTLYREMESEPGIGMVLRRMGHVSVGKNDQSTARAYYQQSLQVWKSLGSRSNISSTLLELGKSYLYDTMEYEEARIAFDESLAISREINDKWSLASGLNFRGVVEFNIGETDKAIAFLENSLEMFRDLGWKAMIALPLANLGVIARFQKDYQKALSLLQEALAIFNEIGFEGGQKYVLVNEGFVSFRQGNWVRAQKLFKESLDLSLDKRESALDIGMALIGLSGLSTIAGEPERAARLLGAAEEWIESKSIPFAGLRAENTEYEHVLSLLAVRLDKATFSRLSNEGRAMATEGIERILEYAF